MDCPRCEGNGLIYEAKVLNKQKNIFEQVFFCDECSLMWNQKEELTIEKSVDYIEDYLQTLGYSGSWNDLIDRKPL